MKGRGEQGSVLLLSMLLILIMAAMALIAVQKVSWELAHVGTYRVAKQGYYVTEAGLTGPIAQAAYNQDAFASFLQGSEFIVRTDDISTDFYEFDTWGSFGPEFSADDSAWFVTYFSDAVDSNRAPGFSTGGFCYRKYTVTADGYLGTESVDTDNPDTLSHTAQARFVAQVYLGPLQCGN